MVSINFNNSRSVNLGNPNSQPQVQPDAKEANQPAKQPQAPAYEQSKTVELTAEQWQNTFGIGGSVNPQPHVLEAPNRSNDSKGVYKPVIIGQLGDNGKIISREEIEVIGQEFKKTKELENKPIRHESPKFPE